MEGRISSNEMGWFPGEVAVGMAHTVWVAIGSGVVPWPWVGIGILGMFGELGVFMWVMGNIVVFFLFFLGEIPKMFL